ncbi:MAG: CCA tRNA nucleotidyltransferase [Kiritimatiellia bacterium]|nr:CCA tRNA nucleotidyltransferase [Kiritimatiellia bacterium]
MKAETPASDPELLEKGALQIVRRLTAAGHRALWAGGFVRDRILGRPPKDIDIATSAPPDRIEELFPNSLDIGKAFGVMVVLQDGRPYEVATFRRDEGIADGRHPVSIAFSDEREDARRRDFTVNALFFDPISREILDYVDGRTDLEQKTIRAVGDPVLRFREDRLRMLRAVRFASTLEFEIEAETKAAIRDQAAEIGRVSVERIFTELTRLWTESPRAGQGLLLLRETGLLDVLLPEAVALAGVEQPPQFHPEGDVFTHTALMLDALPESPDPVLAWSVLLHDIGKPLTAEWAAGAEGPPRWRFNEHDRVGAEMAVAILRRFKAPLRIIEGVEHCVRNHMRFGSATHMRESTLRRLVGHPLFAQELDLHRIDCECSHGQFDQLDFLRQTLDRLKAEPVLPEPLIRGQDLLALGLPEGPEIGRLLRKAYDRQLENPDLTRETLLEWISRGEEPGVGGVEG